LKWPFKAIANKMTPRTQFARKFSESAQLQAAIKSQPCQPWVQHRSRRLYGDIAWTCAPSSTPSDRLREGLARHQRDITIAPNPRWLIQRFEFTYEVSQKNAQAALSRELCRA
jgi:hypothetical protein